VANISLYTPLRETNSCLGSQERVSAPETTENGLKGEKTTPISTYPVHGDLAVALHLEFDGAVGAPEAVAG